MWQLELDSDQSLNISCEPLIRFGSIEDKNQIDVE